MRPCQAAEIRGTYATLLLPVEENDSIDFARLAEEISLLLNSGVDGIYAHGTAGEFYALSEDEFDRVNEVLAAACERADMPFQLGAAFPAPAVALQRVRRAATLRPSAIQVTLPDWYPPTLAESAAFLERAAEAADGVPLVLYNPPHAKKVLTPYELERICDRVPALVGVKVGGGDDAWHQAMTPLMQRISVFVPGHALATGIAHGAAGSYSNVACLQPEGAARWHRLMHNDMGRALSIERQIQDFMKQSILPFREREGFSNMALDKLLAAIGAWAPIGTRLRWPYRGIEEEEVGTLRISARREIPFLFED